MRLGYELIKEQLFFRKEMIERVSWFIRLRWIAVGVAFVTAWVTYFYLNLGYPFIPVNSILVFIVLYNVIFYFVWRWLHKYKTQSVEPFTFFANVQISLDLISLFALIFFTGGVYSPLLIFVIFHVVLTGILLPVLSCYIYSGIILVVIGGFIVAQNSALLAYPPHILQRHVFSYDPQFSNMAVLFLIYAVTILVTAFLVTSIKLTLRTKGRELLILSKELDISNTMLTSLYEMVKGMGLCSDLQELMDLATRKASKIMGVKGCAIKLLDDAGKTLRFASTYGLSENYISKGAIDIEKSPINRKIIEGSLCSIGKIEEKDYFQYPEDIQKEGIESMMCLPLRVEKSVLGVFCVYSKKSYDFSTNEVDFFSLMAELTALSVGNLKSGLNKIWFLQKAAHQLRSPLNAVSSMLTTMIKEYMGSLNNEQKHSLHRCERRIKTLGNMVRDLLKLSVKRLEVSQLEAKPIHLGEKLNSIRQLYEAQAMEKELVINFSIGDNIPVIMADENHIDELFTNLISNAIKYTPSGGKVNVTLDTEEQHSIRFEVSDTGIGIPKEDLKHLFTEFYRSENARAFEEEGTGLGLVIVKEVLDHLKGSVSVKSNIGQGTTFTCLIRVDDDHR